MGSSIVTGYITYKVTSRQIRSAEATASQQRSHEVELARDQREHELKMARDEREQVRKERSYVAVMTYSSYWCRWASHAVAGAGQTEPQEKAPEIDHSAESLASLTMSAEVGKVAWSFADAIVEFQTRWNLFVSARQASIESQFAESYAAAAKTCFREAEAANEKLQRLGDELMEAMRQELGSTGLLPHKPFGLGVG